MSTTHKSALIAELRALDKSFEHAKMDYEQAAIGRRGLGYLIAVSIGLGFVMPMLLTCGSIDAVTGKNTTVECSIAQYATVWCGTTLMIGSAILCVLMVKA